MPDLIGSQIDSYKAFLQMDTDPKQRKNQGLQEVFNEVFPLEGYDKHLEFVAYYITPPKKDVVDCIKDGLSYNATLSVEFNLKDKDAVINEIVPLSEIPMMTDRGTFIINGAERVIISQLHRSPGICFEKSRQSTGRSLYSYRIIPDRGSWMEVQFDTNDNIYIYLDRRRRRRKFLITTFMRAIGYETNKDILGYSYEIKSYTLAQLLKEEDLTTLYTIDDVTGENDELILEELKPMSEK